jgi:hydrogenase maturation protease
MRRVLIVALGNELCGDDGFGPAVLARLHDDPEIAPRADLLLAGTDLLGQIERFLDYTDVLLLDAVLEPSRAGEVVLFEEQELLSWPADAPSGHQISPLLAVRLFRTLHPEAPTRLRLLGLCVEAIALAPNHCAPAALAAARDRLLRLTRCYR